MLFQNSEITNFWDSKSSKIVNLKDEVNFLVLSFFFYLEPFLFHVCGDPRAENKKVFKCKKN